MPLEHIDLHIGRHRVKASLSPTGILSITGTKDALGHPPKTHLSSPVTLLTLKVLNTPATKKGLFTHTDKCHFQLITPTVQLPMYTSSLGAFNELRTAIDAARATALSGSNSGGACELDDECDSQSAPLSGRALLTWLVQKDPSNARCGGCGRPDPQWLAVQRDMWVGLIVCDACSGFYRGRPDFLVRSFLFDVSVFEDRDSLLFKAVTRINNLAACTTLAPLASPLSSSETTPAISSNDPPTPSITATSISRPQTPTLQGPIRLFFNNSSPNASHDLHNHNHHPLSNNYDSSALSTPTTDDPELTYTYMPVHPPSTASSSSSPNSHAHAQNSNQFSSKLSPKSKLHQSLLKTQGKILKLLHHKTSGSSTSHSATDSPPIVTPTSAGSANLLPIRNSGLSPGSGIHGGGGGSGVVGGNGESGGFLLDENGVTVARRKSFTTIERRKEGTVVHANSMAELPVLVPAVPTIPAFSGTATTMSAAHDEQGGGVVVGDVEGDEVQALERLHLKRPEETDKEKEGVSVVE
ncbi:hypothetical protein HDU99_000507 [Rhizoclosmatium hyalinum]|nr:hypothetical protein HDU99_000507 [Rhizoclosmatium hyalinum]